MFRSWYGIQAPMINSSGIELSAIYGFFNTILKLLNSLEPSHFAIAFDTKGPTFRNEIYSEYKANRSEAPDELKIQLNLITEKLPITKITSFSENFYEADDVLGTLSNNLSKNLDNHVYIYSGDSDLHQLIKQNVFIITTSRSGDLKLFNEKEIENTYEGLSPHQIIDFKSLTGDTSDNIPGIPGVGRKTAIKLLNEYKTLENLFKNIEQIKQLKLRNNLDEYNQNSIKAKELVTINQNLNIDIETDKLLIEKINQSNLINLFKEFEFNSLIERYQKSFFKTSKIESGKNKPKKIRLHIVDNLNKLDDLIANLNSQSEFALDTETDSLNLRDNPIVGISICFNDSDGYYLPLQHKDDNNLDIIDALTKFKPILESENILKFAHNVNFDYSVLVAQYKKLNLDLNIKNFNFDTLLAAHILNYPNLGLKNIVKDLFSIDLKPITEIIGSGKNQDKMSAKKIHEVAEYAIHDAYYTYKLKKILERELIENNYQHLFEEIEMKLIPVLIEMQNNGMPLNTNYLNDLDKEFTIKIKDIESKAKNITNKEINLNSPKQLSEILFEDLDLPKSKKTKSGYSTDSQSISDLKNKLYDKLKSTENYNPTLEDSRNIQFLTLIQDYREISKLLSTYIKILPELVNEDTKRVHTKFNQSVTATGRLSSTEPNLQTIPKKSELGKLVRSSFAIKNNDQELVSADYSQIELRVLAHFSKDENLINAFNDGEDIHNFTAAMMYNCKKEDVTSQMRRISKILNFGVLYGLSPYGISRQTDLNVQQGKDFIEMYFTRFPAILNYIYKIKEDAKKTGYVSTFFGRKRYIQELKSNDKRIQAHGERMAINMPIQGTAAEIIKLAMIKISNEISNSKISSKMLLQIHDELVFESNKSDSKQLVNMLSNIMTNVVQLLVPLEINIEIGNNLGEME